MQQRACSCTLHRVCMQELAIHVIGLQASVPRDGCLSAHDPKAGCRGRTSFHLRSEGGRDDFNFRSTTTALGSCRTCRCGSLQILRRALHGDCARGIPDTRHERWLLNKAVNPHIADRHGQWEGSLRRHTARLTEMYTRTTDPHAAK